MGDAANMHELQEDLPSLVVHRISDLFPTLYLLGREGPRNSGVSQAIGGGRCAFRNDQAGGSALGIVFSHEIVRNVADGAAAGHGRHYDMVAQVYRAELGR